MQLRGKIRAALRGDGFLAFLFLLLSAVYLAQATQLRSGLLSDVVGPRTFPILLAIFGLVIGAIFFAKKLRQAPSDEAGYGSGRTLIGECADLVPLLVLLAYVLIMSVLGFLVATFLYVMLTVKLLGQRTWWGSAVFGACLTAAVFALFSYVFEVRLPPGEIMPGLY